MRVKTSVTLDKELLEQLDAATSNRSALIEDILKAHFKKLKKVERDARELELINANLDWLNKEAEDVLEDQEYFLEELEKEEREKEAVA
jgi:metal-responsive CopG/Arc/MetJ family transcriptional regulator